MKKKILVFPCGSEVALEIYKALQYSTHFEIIGANSIDDHGKFIFENYVGGLPFFNDKNFIEELKKVINTKEIDILYPAMDSVIAFLKENEKELNVKVISPEIETTKLCLSKSVTYKKFKNILPIPKIFELNEIDNYPVFVKPDVGYGSRGAKIINDFDELKIHLKKWPDAIIMENLVGEEYTIDCFTNYNGILTYADARGRNRVMNGISVNSNSVENQDIFVEYAKKINSEIKMNGAWFFQVKIDEFGTLKLLEIASRIAGTSALQRAKGVNLPLMNVFNALGLPVEIIKNDYNVVIDRALSNKFKVDIEYENIYIDLDDTIIVNGLINLQMIQFIYKSINEEKNIYLITKHEKNLEETLNYFKLNDLFNTIFHLKKDDEKWKYINLEKSIFIDDSFYERNSVKINTKIPVFSPENIEILL